MGRSQEFSQGALFKRTHLDGTEESRNAIDAAGGDHTQSPWYGVAGSMEGPDLEYEKRWSQSYDD